MQVFIDESGDLGERGSKYLVLAAIVIEDQKPLKNIIKRMRTGKFQKELRTAKEIKASSSSKQVKVHLLRAINSVSNVRVLIFVVLEKGKLYSEFLRKDRHRLYNYVAGKLAKNLPDGLGFLEIIIDKSKGKQLLQEDFNTYFSHNCRTARLSIRHSQSEVWAGLQFADVLAWACFQKFEMGNGEYLDLVTLEREVYHVF
ncbi:MAG: DUF3800 domain-containing protein [Candidatus Micrarchaeia archaeon]